MMCVFGLRFGAIWLRVAFEAFFLLFNSLIVAFEAHRIKQCRFPV